MSTGFRLHAPADLRPRNSFGVAASTPRLVEVHDSSVLADLFTSGVADAQTLVLGGGSNLLIACDTAPPMLQIVADGVRVLTEDADHVTVRAEAGLAWNALVLWTAERGWWGLENLALIPGTVGAAPIQNIGAYGSEVAQTITQVHAFHRGQRRLQVLPVDACAFGYRDSVFKQQPADWIVTAVDLRLSTHGQAQTAYAGLADELHACGIANPSPLQMAQAVARVRRRKLPDPAVLGNAGSFFKNPLVAAAEAEHLLSRYPHMPVHGAVDAALRKLSAAWLIDQCGWKGRRVGDAGIAAQHALVLVNHGRATGSELLDLARAVTRDVHERFGIALEPEPRLIGATW